MDYCRENNFLYPTINQHSRTNCDRLNLYGYTFVFVSFRKSNQ